MQILSKQKENTQMAIYKGTTNGSSRSKRTVKNSFGSL